ncbi:uncharacterized protein ACLA_040890 [Aspergillus clavatus NRRL 1]|uniref:Uncharacterized protein n=1 Tax=Aspergillus clavatus (strain ATCC 1007 / CBS 513.65 / DSM 816 / NCTC 3887 / NRRL 1 / QM 1276 / 107) TaxID=344612 RepID=A1CL49_ASPCL|nr:uncharacterized protein ACLA_040890 [Aspergillus clavatus NRRL 1]EAW09873.1 conserved hypothetical protein [Aspergillus clavatus NRRL 1]
MYQTQCDGMVWSTSGMQDSSGMRSPTSSTSSNASWEAGSSQQRLLNSFDNQQTSPVSLVQEQFSTARQSGGSGRLKRRASQGSLLTKPSSVSRFLSRSNVSLHLPPFENLGLSSKSSSRVESRTHSVEPRLRLTTTSVSNPQTVHTSPVTSVIWDTSSKDCPQSDYPATLPPTPPEDDEHVLWNSNSKMLLFDSHMNRNPAPIPMDEGPNMDNSPRGTASDGLGSPSDGLSNSSPPSSDGSRNSPGGDMDCDHDSWLESSIESTVSSLPFSNARGEPVKIVSQTLPYPYTSETPTPNRTTEGVFTSLVHVIQNRRRQGQSPYINVTHAVPEQFSLTNLPSSPPGTPRCMLPGNDYFNSTVFSSAAVVSAYHDFRGPIQTKASHFPMPIVPPHSVHISVLERYIPPSSPQEYRDLFSPHRPSFLVDRLSELSPDGGSLLFIYPTRRGGSAFKSQYLGPILDPLLRQLVVVNELSTDIGRYLGKLSSVSHMEDFDTMRHNLSELCRALSSSSSSEFTIVDARKGSAHLDRNLWAEWYIHQEKARMKEVLSLYWQNGRRLPVSKAASNIAHPYILAPDKEVTSAMLLGEILDGIRRRPYGEESEPHDGVELGVFVIRRSH